MITIGVAQSLIPFSVIDIYVFMGNNISKIYRGGNDMKRLVQISAVFFSILCIMGIASAEVYNFGDIYYEWPGHATSYSGTDLVGVRPDISGGTVETYGNGNLKSIVLYTTPGWMSYRLFINLDRQNGSYENWDFYAQGNEYQYSFYEIVKGYTYTLADASGREGHPNGIATEGLSLSNLLISLTYSNGMLVYEFADSDLLKLGELGQFVIGFTADCANDVFLTPVPEPATMLLLGLGLVGVAAIRRRMK